jgi:hypothetical protein
VGRREWPGACLPANPCTELRKRLNPGRLDSRTEPVDAGDPRDVETRSWKPDPSGGLDFLAVSNSTNSGELRGDRGNIVEPARPKSETRDPRSTNQSSNHVRQSKGDFRQNFPATSVNFCWVINLNF